MSESLHSESNRLRIELAVLRGQLEAQQARERARTLAFLGELVRLARAFRFACERLKAREQGGES